MDTYRGFRFSWAGFLDYTACYHTLRPFEVALGTAVFVGTGLSVVPQLFRIARRRTSLGVSPTFTIVTSAREFLVVVNIFCLHNADFYGLLQIAPTRTIPRLLTFAQAFILWSSFLPVVYMTFIFFDTCLRQSLKRSEAVIAREWTLNLTLSILLTCIAFTAMVVYMGIGGALGFGSSSVERMGKIVGLISAGLTIIQYVPQFMLACRLKDNASFSLVTLGIQAPGGTIAAIFQMVANKEDWSTDLSLALSAMQEWILFVLCMFYKCRRSLWEKHPRDTDAVCSLADDAMLDRRPLLTTAS
jgi:cystinosin